MTVKERLIQRCSVDASSGCWLWKLSVNIKSGYGQIQYSGKKHLAHRLSYQTFKGEIPKGLVVMHTCDVPSCINPEHLVLGTQAENIQDMKDKGRQARGSNHGRSRLTEAQVEEIRELKGTMSQREIAEKYGVSAALVGFIHNNKRWTSQQTDKE